VRLYGKYGLSRSPQRAVFDSLVFGAAYAITYLPQVVDRWLVWVTMLGYRSILRRKVRVVAAKMGAALGGPGDTPARWMEISLAYWRMRVETHWMRAREMHRRAPTVTITLEGIEHLEDALERGRGAIVWRMFFCSSHVPMRALAEAGYPLVHLSHWDHGNRGLNWPGLRVFAPMYLKAEVRYLSERVVLPQNESLDYLRRLVARLEENHAVSIFGNIQGRSPVSAEILGVKRLLASGAPSLARKTGAPLLTMRARRVARDHYVVTIDPPIGVDARLGRRAFTESAVAEYARRVEAAVREHPESWYRWATYTDHREA
jgi:lauroyl/myristoyl acyltransferase